MEIKSHKERPGSDELELAFYWLLLEALQDQNGYPARLPPTTSQWRR